MRFGKLMALALAGLMVLGGCAKENADPTFYNEGLSLIAAMAERYDAPAEVLQRDVSRVLEQLRSVGALVE